MKNDLGRPARVQGYTARNKASAEALGIGYGDFHPETGMIYNGGGYWVSPAAFDRVRYGSILRGAKERASEKGVAFDLTADWFASAFPPDGICPVLGITLAWGSADFSTSPSIDRLIPANGYIKANCRIISNRANMLKNNASIDEMRLILRDLENHQ